MFVPLLSFGDHPPFYPGSAPDSVHYVQGTVVSRIVYVFVFTVFITYKVQWLVLLFMSVFTVFITYRVQWSVLLFTSVFTVFITYRVQWSVLLFMSVFTVFITYRVQWSVLVFMSLFYSVHYVQVTVVSLIRTSRRPVSYLIFFAWVCVLFMGKRGGVCGKHKSSWTWWTCAI